MFDPNFMIELALYKVGSIVGIISFYTCCMVLLFCICLKLIRGKKYDTSNENTLYPFERDDLPPGPYPVPGDQQPGSNFP